MSIGALGPNVGGKDDMNLGKTASRTAVPRHDSGPHDTMMAATPDRSQVVLSKAAFDLHKTPVRPMAIESAETRSAAPRRHTGAAVALFLAAALGGGVLAVYGLGAAHQTAAAPPPMVQVQPSDSDQVHTLIQQRFGDAEKVHVSHNWALGIANDGQDDMSVLLHKDQGQWSIAASDGGAYDAATLAQHQVPQNDIQALLQTYQ